MEPRVAGRSRLYANDATVTINNLSRLTSGNGGNGGAAGSGSNGGPGGTGGNGGQCQTAQEGGAGGGGGGGGSGMGGFGGGGGAGGPSIVIYENGTGVVTFTGGTPTLTKGTAGTGGTKGEGGIAGAVGAGGIRGNSAVAEDTNGNNCYVVFDVLVGSWAWAVPRRPPPRSTARPETLARHSSRTSTAPARRSNPRHRVERGEPPRSTPGVPVRSARHGRFPPRTPLPGLM